MKNIIITIILLFSVILSGCSNELPGAETESIASTELKVTGSDVIYYTTENVQVKGYYARPINSGNYPGVIMIHEWWGLNDGIKAYADKLAAQGYNVLAVDLYNGKIATIPDEARNYSRSLNQPEAIENMNAAYAYLESQQSSKIGSLGWCFGGGQSMQLAINNKNIDATVIYYGNLVANESQLQSISWPILGIFGDKDTSITPAKVEEFKTAINNVGIQNEIYMYPGVGHAFANPSGQNYALNETIDAWSKTLTFLEKTLKN